MAEQSVKKEDGCGDEDLDYDEILRVERVDFVRRARALGYEGCLTPETAVSRLVRAAQTGELQNVPDPITAGIFEQMERQVRTLTFTHMLRTKRSCLENTKTGNCYETGDSCL